MSQYDSGRTNSNQAEYTLTPQSVSSGGFGKLFSRSVTDGVYALPLIVPNLVISDVERDVMFVATMANTVYAFDATDPHATDPIWSVNLGSPMPLPNGSWFLSQSFGIIGTPAADLHTQTLYLVAKIQNQPDDIGLYLFAMDMVSGDLKYNSPQRMRFPDGGQDILHVPDAIQRAGLLLDDGVVFVAVAAVFTEPGVHASQEGYVQSFDALDLSTRLGSFQVTPDGLKGGIWQAGRGVTADPQGNVYVATAGGFWDGTNDWGSSILKLDPQTLAVVDWFTPSNWEDLYLGNLDPSANGVTAIPGTSLIFAGGKEGVIYLLDQLSLGHFEGGPLAPLQRFQASQGCGMTDCAQTLGTAYWDGGLDDSQLFVWDRGDVLRRYRFDATTHRFDTAFDYTSDPAAAPVMTGGPTISSAVSDLGSAVVWAVTTDGNSNDTLQPGTLRAFSAQDLSEIFSSDSLPSDELGTFTKFAPPVVANGRVYVATHSGEVVVYGLLSQPSLPALGVPGLIGLSLILLGSGGVMFRRRRRV